MTQKEAVNEILVYRGEKPSEAAVISQQESLESLHLTLGVMMNWAEHFKASGAKFWIANGDSLWNVRAKVADKKYEVNNEVLLIAMLFIIGMVCKDFNSAKNMF